MTQLRTFTEFLYIPITFYLTIGEEIYDDRSTNRRRSLLLRIFFYMGFINFNLVVLGEFLYFVKALSSLATLLEATAVAPCVGFAFVGNLKQITINVYKKVVLLQLDELERHFPASLQLQRDYDLAGNEKKMHRIMYIFSGISLGYTTLFSMYPICKALIKYYILGYPFERNLCFYILYPYNPKATPLIYTISYISEVFAAHVAGVAFISADLLLVASVTLICMHFNYLSNRLEQWNDDDSTTPEQNEAFLKEIAAQHAKCLDLSEDVNKIFSFSLLLNFITASLTICFIGFQVTTSSAEDIFKYFIFLMASLIQVLVICYYGDELMTASGRVGVAAYNQNWFGCDLKYKKMLLYLMMRSQKEASIRAPTFPPISFNTYMKVISMSYQFFALLRTTYNE